MLHFCPTLSNKWCTASYFGPMPEADDFDNKKKDPTHREWLPLCFCYTSAAYVSFKIRVQLWIRPICMMPETAHVKVHAL
jgi:hypothetical protein